MNLIKHILILLFSINIYSEINDPFEDLNRASFQINETVDSIILKPIAVTYSKAPTPIKHGITNFFRNLKEVDNTVMNFDHIISKSSTGKFHIDNQDTIKKLQAMVRRYKNQAMKHLDNVSHGKF